MHAVVQDIERERARNDPIRNGSREDKMCEPCEGRLEREEEDGGHNKSEAVHREVVVDTVHQEVEGEEGGGVGEVEVDVE